jgi:hypothetical protein
MVRRQVFCVRKTGHKAPTYRVEELNNDSVSQSIKRRGRRGFLAVAVRSRSRGCGRVCIAVAYPPRLALRLRLARIATQLNPSIFDNYYSISRTSKTGI